MSVPLLAARVEQPHNLTGHRVKGSKTSAFVLVTERACEPEVSLLGQSPERLRNDVVDLHGGTDHGLLSQTIAHRVKKVIRHPNGRT